MMLVHFNRNKEGDLAEDDQVSYFSGTLYKVKVILQKRQQFVVVFEFDYEFSLLHTEKRFLVHIPCLWVGIKVHDNFGSAVNNAFSTVFIQT